MVAEPSEDMMAVLPDGFGDYYGGVPGYVSEDVHAHSLVPDEPVPQLRVVGVAPEHVVALPLEGGPYLVLHLLLGGPALLVRA